MAIQPIDLQTLYTQLENVSKNVAFQQQGMQFKNDVHQAEQARTEFQKKQNVTKAQEDESQAATVKDRNGNGTQPGGGSSQQKKKQEEEVPEVPEIQIHDPYLGRIIDIQG